MTRLTSMNTYRMYEELRAVLGDPAAKSLADHLGSMFEELRNTVTKDDFRSLTDSMDARSSRLETAMIQLVEAQTRTEARVGQLDARMGELAEAQARTEARVEQLTESQSRLWDAQTRLEGRMTELADAQKGMAQALERLSIRTDAVVGRTFELQFRDRLTAYLGRVMRRGKLLANDTLLDAIEPTATDEEIDDFLRAYAVASGLVDGVPSHVVVEVSSVGDMNDIVRAQRRAEILGKAGLTAIALVACEAIAPDSLAFARMRHVRVWCNGSLLESAA